jgi:hypothetical protein
MVLAASAMQTLSSTIRSVASQISNLVRVLVFKVGLNRKMYPAYSFKNGKLMLICNVITHLGISCSQAIVQQ